MSSNEKKVQLTIQVNNSFLRLLKAEIELSQMKKKADTDQATPSMLLALTVFAEARGALETQVDEIMSHIGRSDELQVLHDQRKVVIPEADYDRTFEGKRS